MAKAKELPAPADPTELARMPEHRWADKAEVIAEDPLNDFLVFATGGILLGTLVGVVLTGIAWAAFLGSFGLVFGNFALRAQKTKRAKLRGLVQDALHEQQQTHAHELQARDERHSRERVALQEAHAQEMTDERDALLAASPLARSVTIHHTAIPQVMGDGKVTMFLRAVNHSPFPVRLHSPRFTPYLGDVPADDPVTLPAEAPLPPHDGFVDLTVTGRFPPRAFAGATHVGVHMNNGISVVRDDDSQPARVGVFSAPGGDWVKIVRIT